MPIKTRQQRLQEAEAGAQPSPPRSLIDEPRAKRSRTNKSSAHAPSQDPPATQPSASAQISTTTRVSTSKRSGKATQRGGRGKARVRLAPSAQTHIQDHPPEASDASTQPDVAAHSNASGQVDADATHLNRNADGEIQTSRSSSEATHPVLAGTPTAPLVRDANNETQASPGSGATQPVYVTTPSPTSTHPVQGKRSPSETSELFRQILFSPSSPTTSATNHGTPVGNQAPRTSPQAAESAVAGTPPSIGNDASRSSTEATEPALAGTLPSIGNDASRPSTEATEPALAGTPPFIRAQPVPPDPMASPSHPVMPKVYGLPAERTQNYSLIHILVDSLPATTGNGPAPRKDSHIAFAIPSSRIPKFLALSARHFPGLTDVIKEHPVASKYVNGNKLTYVPFIDTPVTPPSEPLRKRKRNDEEETSETEAIDEAPAKSVGKTMRQAFAQMAEERRRVALEEFRSQAPIPEIEVLEEELIDPRLDNPYTYDEVPDPDERRVQGLSINPQDQVQQEQVPETPPARGWGLSSFLPSVSRFIPFSSRRTPSDAAAPPRVPPNAQEPAESLTTNEPSSGELLARLQPLGSRLGAQTEPRERSDATISRHDDQGLATSSAFAQRVHKEKPQRILLTKQQAEERRKLKQEKEELRADKERLVQEVARIAQEKKEWEEERARATGAHIPGTKRKRVPSPEFYPLPARGFGLVDAIFDYSSDEDSDEEEQDTPTRPRPSKKARVSSSSIEANGDPGAPPLYEGGTFVGAGASSEGAHGNVFGRRATVNTEANMTTPSGPSRNTFTVPSPTDSDPDGEADEEWNANATPLPSQQDQPSQGATTSPSKSMPPPPTPNLSQATLPSAPTWAFIDPVEKAREKALKHQPKYGSRLRESSRLSSSTVGSEAGIQPLEDDAEFDETQYDPRSPATLPNIVPSPRGPAMLPNIFPSPRGPALPNIFPSNQATSAFGAQSANNNTTVRHGHVPWDGLGFSYDSYRNTMTPRVEEHIEVTWDEDGDDVLIGLGDRRFDADFEAWKQEQDSEEATGNGTKALETGNEPDQLSYEKADISARVRALIDDNVTEEDKAMAIKHFDEEYEAWKAKEMKKQDGLTPSIAA